MSMNKKGEHAYAYKFCHYNLVKDGSDINRKVEREQTPSAKARMESGPPALNNSSTPPNVATPAAPPAIARQVDLD